MPRLPSQHTARGTKAPPPPSPPQYPHVELADQYARDVVEGRILACKWVKLACARYQRDRARESDPAWPYRLDGAKAEKVCRFTELMPHTKGKWAQKRELLKLGAWQAWILVNVFGWVRKSDGLRRFRKALIVVPRKNGKSALSAPVGLYMLAADGEHGAEVYSGATTEKQAWEVFKPAQLMARARPDLLEHFGIEVNASNIHILANGSKFEPLIGKPGDGSSPSCAIVDEYHEHDTPDQHDTMLTGMGAREQPLLWIITTAGDNLAGPCFDELLTLRKILDGVLEDEERFGVEYTIDEGDDWTAPEALIKANPNLDVSVSGEFLLARQREAVRNTREQGRFKTKHLNLWVNARSAYFNMQSWAMCRDLDLTLGSLEGERCIIGMDLASKQDIAALQLLFPLGEKRFATFGRYYLPEDIIEEPGRDHYRGWALSDPPQLILTEGNMIDFDRIEEDLEDLRQRFTVDEVVFDPAQATMLMGRLMNKGVTVTQFDQNARNYSEPMKEVAALIDAGLLTHDCDERAPMTWMMSNVTARLDAKEQVFPRKEKDENKIDGPVALIMAMARAMGGDPSAGRSVYEDRGLLVFGS
ncbi:terminase large subunit [Roseomonas elaeocarpi]|uniref:Terminase large subunit n=1 Tax=Roseomonas elaeocarpi TaxID=907779 RepID=A0ABV6JQE6_9PROT